MCLYPGRFCISTMYFVLEFFTNTQLCDGSLRFSLLIYFFPYFSLNIENMKIRKTLFYERHKVQVHYAGIWPLCLGSIMIFNTSIVCKDSKKRKERRRRSEKKKLKKRKEKNIQIFWEPFFSVLSFIHLLIWYSP